MVRAQTVEQLRAEVERLEAEQRSQAVRFDIGMKACGALLLFAIGIVAVQCFQWLRSGQWPRFPLYEAAAYIGVGSPNVSWRGVQSIIDYIWTSPTSAVSFALALALMFFLTIGDERSGGDPLWKARQALQKAEREQNN